MVNPRYSMRKGHEYPFVEMASVGENFAGILQIAARSLVVPVKQTVPYRASFEHVGLFEECRMRRRSR